jgi:N-acetyl sugar amidotransferase
MENKKYQICTKCIMDTSDPEITFDSMGVCNHCIKFETNQKPKWFPNEEGKKKLDTIIDNIKTNGKNKEYDCVIGLSGGVDSSYLAYVLRTQYPDLKILAIHIDGGWNSELAVHNIESIVEILDIDLHTGVINWEEMKDLQLAYFKSQLANQDVPQDHAFFATLYDMANKYGIQYFLTGANLATESILPKAWGYKAMDATQLKAVHKQFGKIKLKEYTTVSFFRRTFYYPHIKKFKIIAPLDLMPYNKDEAKEIIMEKLNWRDYGGKHHESRFTKFFQAHWLPTKFGYDKRRAHLASLVVSEQISREDALKEMEKPLYDPSELEEDIEFLSKKMGLSVKEFNDIMAQPNRNFTDYPSDFELEKKMRSLKQYLKKLKR